MDICELRHPTGDGWVQFCSRIYNGRMYALANLVLSAWMMICILSIFFFMLLGCMTIVFLFSGCPDNMFVCFQSMCGLGFTALLCGFLVVLCHDYEVVKTNTSMHAYQTASIIGFILFGATAWSEAAPSLCLLVTVCLLFENKWRPPLWQLGAILALAFFVFGIVK
ncbi:MAG: hypothetical protein K2Z81_10635 [Cyanobacteria bacterium]|nr:hypothetical protein [Cyanobacteriota bacterium]